VVAILALFVAGALWALFTGCRPKPPPPYLHYKLPDHPKYPETPLHHLYAFHLLSPEVCAHFVDTIEAYAKMIGGWTTKRHASYPTTDIPIKHTPLWPEAKRVVYERVFPLMARAYGIKKRNLNLHDLFFVKYDADTPEAQKHLDFHRDGSLLSFSILCNDPAEFDGGGTVFDALGGAVVEPEACGDLVIHSGKLRHSGQAITRGQRYLIVGFVKVLGSDVNHNLLQNNRTSKKGIDLDYMLVTHTIKK